MNRTNIFTHSSLSTCSILPDFCYYNSCPGSVNQQSQDYLCLTSKALGSTILIKWVADGVRVKGEITFLVWVLLNKLSNLLSLTRNHTVISFQGENFATVCDLHSTGMDPVNSHSHPDRQFSGNYLGRASEWWEMELATPSYMSWPRKCHGQTLHNPLAVSALGLLSELLKEFRAEAEWRGFCVHLEKTVDFILATQLPMQHRKWL